MTVHTNAIVVTIRISIADLIGGDGNTDVCPGRQTPSRHHCACARAREKGGRLGTWRHCSHTLRSKKRPRVYFWNNTHTHTHTHPFNGPFSGTTRVSRYQKGKTNLDFTEARDSEWQRHQLGRMQVCTSLQTDNHASTPLLSFLYALPAAQPTASKH